MRISNLAFPAALFALSLSWLGCKINVAVDPPGEDCEGPAPQIPEGAWCPPVYECIDGEWVDTAGACPDPECPAKRPADGKSCDLEGQQCSYEEDVPCGPIETVTAVCEGGAWVSIHPYCQPEPDCPEVLPVMGADCSGWDFAYACSYFIETACGQQAAFVSCSSTEEGAQVWTLQGGVTCDICSGYGSMAECGLAPECQWLTPGCGDTPTETGCYPKTGCDVTGCTDDSICVETTYNPCANQPCDACGAPYFACLPVDAP